MKVAHAVVVTPGRCGLYETTKELVTNLRSLGLDSRLVDPDPENNPVYKDIPKSDGDIPIADIEWLKQADVIISHSGLGGIKTDKPKIYVAHGRPLSSYLGEVQGKAPIYSYSYNESKKKTFKAVVTFWPEHKDYLEVMWDAPIHVVTAPVDLKKWTPQGPSGYKFNGKAGEKNIVITDAWRDDVDPFICLNAYAVYNRRYPGSKLHIYAHPQNQRGWGAIVQKIKDHGGLGEMLPRVSGLDNVYRAADLTLTPHTIAVRTMRESLACGCPVLTVKDLDPEKIRVALELDRGMARAKAETTYNPMNSARQFKAVIDGVIG